MTDVKAAAVTFENVSIVFGRRPENALPLMDEGLDRAEIQRQTGLTMGVHNCSLVAAPGETLVLMGLSGSGKSTLLRAVNGLNPLARGDVVVRWGENKVRIADASREDLRKVRRQAAAMVFQNFGLLPWRTVRENVALGLEISGISRTERLARADAQLDLVGLADWGDRKVSELSGGMRQRVGLARAFSTEAPILLMDEPFSALDPLIRARLQDELLDLQERMKRTIIFVSHDLDEAFKLGDRIAIMEGGRIAQQGTPREILSAPASDYVADFIAHMNPLSALTVGDAMSHEIPPKGPEIDSQAPLRAALTALRGVPALRVTRGGKTVGGLTAETAVARLADSVTHTEESAEGAGASSKSGRKSRKAKKR